jgi:uncharacterized protein (DUF488 family)
VTTFISIGYEGRTPDELIDSLIEAQVERLLDVRALPLSRKKGFSKTALAARLAASGIEYLHLRAAGNPFRHLRADPERCLAAYDDHLRSHPEVLDLVMTASRGHRVAMLCVERQPATCHRSRILQALKARHRSVQVIDLADPVEPETY